MSNDKKEIKNIPQHVAIIMDGNGRWAKQRNRERVFGHHAGVESVKKITEVAAKYGIKYLTIYAFSKENWDRPKDEVDSLMSLLMSGMTENLPEIKKQNIKLLTIGDFDTLPEDVKISVNKAIAETQNNSGLTLVIALNYGSRWEILNAVKNIANKVKTGQMNIEDIDEQNFASNLLTNNIPDPDLLIRTSGENRISNFLLWQISYSEIYFTKVLWPDFREEQFVEALKDYSSRERRFGKTSEQIK